MKGFQVPEHVHQTLEKKDRCLTPPLNALIIDISKYQIMFGRHPARIGDKYAKKPQNLRFFTQRPHIGDVGEMGAKNSGKVLKVAGGNFVHTVKISGPLN